MRLPAARLQRERARALGDREQDPVLVVVGLELEVALVAQAVDERADLLDGHLGLADEAHEAAEVASATRAARPWRARRRGPRGPPPGSRPRARTGARQCQTERTSALSTPMPKALVATTTSASPRMNASCARGALVGGHAGVVGGGAQALGREHRRGLLGRLARAAVDDRGAVLLELEAGDQRRALAGHAALAVEREDVEGEVRAVEAGAHALGLPEAEPRDDLLRDLRRRGRGAGHRRRVAELADDRRRAAGSRAGSRGPTRTRSAPRRPRTARACGCWIALPERGVGEALGGGEDDRRPAAADLVERAARCPRRRPASRRGGRGRSGARTGRASARSAATRRPSDPRWRARAAGSRGSCRRRWA